MTEKTEVLVLPVPVVGMTVGQAMSRPVTTAAPGETLKQVAVRMLERGVSVIPVVDRTGAIEGVITDTDLIRIVTSPHRGEVIVNAEPNGTTTVGSLMTRHVIGIREDADVTQAACLMVEQGLKALPVLSGSRLVGMVTRKDLLRLIVRPDEDVHREVSDALGLVTDRPLTFSVKDGVVTFDHWVEPGGRRYLEHAIKRVPGVFGVVFVESSP